MNGEVNLRTFDRGIGDFSVHKHSTMDRIAQCHPTEMFTSQRLCGMENHKFLI